MDVVRKASRLVSILLIVASAAVFGCRTDPRIIALERENRDLEDEIYALQDLLDRTQDALEASQPPGAAAAVVAPAQIPSTQAAPSLPRTQGGAAGAPRTQPGGARALRGGDSIAPPSPYGQPKSGGASSGTPAVSPTGKPSTAPALPIEIHVDPTPDGKPSSRGSRSRGQTMGRHDPPRQDSQVQLTGAAVPATIAVVQVTLSDRAMGGFNRDGQPGDEGIRVLVEPRDSAGALLATPGRVSIVLLDPALAGEASRVARWELDPEQVAAARRSTAAGEGFYLELPWSHGYPSHNQLEVYVRYWTDDGRKLEAHQPIYVHLAERTAEAPRTASSMPAPPARSAPAATARRSDWSPERR